MIRSFVGDIMLPGIYGLFSKSTNVVSSAFPSKMNPDNFIKELVTWIMVIIVTFVIIGYVFKAWIKKPTAPVAPIAPAAHAAPTTPAPPVKKDNGDAAGAVITEHFIRSRPW